MNVAGRTRYHSDLKHPYWWGILGLIIIEVTVIAIFLASYFYLWIVNVSTGRMGWPAQGTVLPPVLIPAINTGLLLFCGWSMWYGGILIKKNKSKEFAYLALACCVVAGLVLYLRWIQMEMLEFDWGTNAYASFVWVLTGFHFLHVLAGILGTLVIGWFSYKGYYNEQRMLGVQIDTIYWYYIVAAWPPIYFVLYWTPRITW
ncbi:MAG: heme-copper oxidase subunit III [Bacteriovoracaceae bacterium]|nr:heme-copper oxidase subunit III [Bacteriovoracaceae bacterium]